MTIKIEANKFEAWKKEFLDTIMRANRERTEKNLRLKLERSTDEVREK